MIALAWLVGCAVTPGQPWSTPAGDPITAYGAVVGVDPVHPGTEDPLSLQVLVEPRVAGAPAVWTTRWSRDGALVPELAGRWDVPASATAAGEVWTGELVVLAGGEERAFADEVVIEDSAPVVSVSVAPSAPVAGEDLVATATVVDPDGAEDPSWTWLVDDRAVEADGPVLPGELTARGQVWLVRARVEGPFGPIDGWGGAVVRNSAPTADGAVVLPAPPTVTDGATCAGIGLADADGDAVEVAVAWFVDGATVSDPVGDFLDGSHFVRDQQVRCELWPFDGELHGDVLVSATATVGNSPPGPIQEAKLLPVPPQVGKALFLAVDRPGTDPDEDELTQDCVFSVDGAYHSTGTAVDASEIAVGQVWTCEARNFDGEAYGEPLVLVTQPAITPH